MLIVARTLERELLPRRPLIGFRVALMEKYGVEWSERAEWKDHHVILATVIAARARWWRQQMIAILLHLL